MYTASEAAHVISTCENHLKREKISDKPFTVDEIRGGILKDFLTDANYLAPFEVTIFSLFLPFFLQLPEHVFHQSQLIVHSCEHDFISYIFLLGSSQAFCL